ncbi:MAG TPA: cytochrome c oxidase subunit II [Candidatus Limnocylindria bacterium]|nr:cytochrome c oxidase subunit II [Candidatus Limnocylindria bacterium]
MTKNFFGTPLIASEHGAGIDALTWYIHALMAVLFVGWAIYFVYVLLRFRRTRNASADHAGVQSHFSTYVEVGVAVTEAVLLIGFAVPLWARSVEKFPEEKSSVVVRVVGRQFNWIARYAGKDGVFGKQDVKFVSGANPMGIDQNDPNTKDDVTVLAGSEVGVPVNTNVIVHITSLDVIHSFKVFPMRVNQDAIPGMSIPVHFKPTKVGTYPINCAQLCGVGHSTMKGTLKVMEPADYEKWLADKSGGGGFE